MTITKLSSSQAKKRTSLKERVSEAEWKVRTDLAAAYQLAVVYGWTDMILTHFSARVPDAENQFLLNAYANRKMGSHPPRELVGMPVGQVVSRMNQIRTTKAVVQEMVEEYVDTATKLVEDLQG